MLDKPESDPLGHIMTLAEEYLGSHERAMNWLNQPNHALGGLAPMASNRYRTRSTSGRKHPGPYRLRRNQLIDPKPKTVQTIGGPEIWRSRGRWLSIRILTR